ncbi:DUF3179 domain-containing protein [Sulfidibacter corallicola]|nr:DUF3179 domain-containing protein [Sulfidibacter corallicola]
MLAQITRIVAVCLCLTMAPHAFAQKKKRPDPVKILQTWKTDLTKSEIDLGELLAGGPGKDGIPPIDDPVFVTVSDAAAWLDAKDPVIALKVGDDARAYPLQILMWHEIVNDTVGGTPVSVTFCPLCNATAVFDRRFEGAVLDFGVSGFLRKSDLVMYDRQTESLWQQFTGEGLVGTHAGKFLDVVPSQLIGFAQFRKAHPQGKVLSRETGHDRAYGQNPYVDYDETDRKPFLFKDALDERLPPMERVITVKIGKKAKAYPYSRTRQKRVIHDKIAKRKIVVFHAEGAASALDKKEIAASEDIGATGVFDPEVDGKVLKFSYRDGLFVDAQTKSEWDITGTAIAGPMKGKSLKPIAHGNDFAFAWLAFMMDTKIYGD